MNFFKTTFYFLLFCLFVKQTNIFKVITLSHWPIFKKINTFITNKTNFINEKIKTGVDKPDFDPAAIKEGVLDIKNTEQHQHPFQIIRSSPWPFWIGVTTPWIVMSFAFHVLHADWYSTTISNTINLSVDKNCPFTSLEKFYEPDIKCINMVSWYLRIIEHLIIMTGHEFLFWFSIPTGTFNDKPVIVQVILESLFGLKTVWMVLDVIVSEWKEIIIVLFDFFFSIIGFGVFSLDNALISSFKFVFGRTSWDQYWNSSPALLYIINIDYLKSFINHNFANLQMFALADFVNYWEFIDTRWKYNVIWRITKIHELLSFQILCLFRFIIEIFKYIIIYDTVFCNKPDTKPGYRALETIAFLWHIILIFLKVLAVLIITPIKIFFNFSKLTIDAMEYIRPSASFDPYKEYLISGIQYYIRAIAILGFCTEILWTIGVFLFNKAIWPILWLFDFKNHKTHSHAWQIEIVCLIIWTVSIKNWIRDLINEATFFGKHTKAVQNNLMFGFSLFIASEIMVFFGLIWSYLYFKMTPSPALGCVWPPKGVVPLDPFGIALANTLILVYSGLIVNISLKAIRAQKKKAFFWSLIFTLLLGVFFLTLQSTEYIFATFSISDSVFGSLFYLTTGAHGLHVFAGVILLLICLIRAFYSHLRADHHNSLITAVIYWHFVDIVWLLVYFLYYLWL